MIYRGFCRHRTWLMVGTLIAGISLWQASIAGAGEDAADAAAIGQAKSLSRAFRAAARRVLPTVVQIKTITRPHRVESSLPPENPFWGTPFEEWFGEDFPGFRRYSIRPEPQPQPGLGSGVIIDASGIVLTNNHVVEGVDKVTVQLGDGREFEAVDTKTDYRTDLAVVRIKPEGPLPAARLGDSDKLQIGDWVIAIGHPFALEQTVSAGIISAKGRTVGDIRRTTFLQTDAVINLGNSGGPLVNLDGEVVGISTAIFSPSGGYYGIGFAIPINTAKWVAPQLIGAGTVARAYLGIKIGKIDADLARQLGVAPHEGLVVAKVFEDSPADQAGLREDDVILTFDGRPLRTPNDLQELVERSPAGSRHELKIVRRGDPQTLQVVVKAMPDDFDVALALGDGDATAVYQSGALGLAVVDLSKSTADRLGYEPGSGVLVVGTDRRGIAHQAGLREMMLIRRVGDRPVRNVREFAAAIENESLETGIKLEVQTGGGTEILTLERR